MDTEMVERETETKVDFQQKFSRDFFADDETRLDVEFAAATHTGKVRRRNEDHFAVIRRSRNCEMLCSNLPDKDVAFVEDHAYGIIVADGIGGAEFGDFASQLAIETVLQAAGLATSWLMRLKDLESQEVRKRIAAYVDRIQEAFRSIYRSSPETKSMGTTLTAAYLMPPHAITVNIGDSRAYLFRSGQLVQVTRDQTLAQTLVDAGAKQEEVRRYGNILMNSLGASSDQVEFDLIHVQLQPGDRLLVCTDGLSDLVDAESISATLSTSDVGTACGKLVDLALEAGGRDNITVVVCGITEPAFNSKVSR
jgi:protein phosphatase